MSLGRYFNPLDETAYLIKFSVAKEKKEGRLEF